MAIKIYLSLDQNGLREFEKEFYLSKDLSHPNIVNTFYFGHVSQNPFMVMEFFSEGSLSNKIGKLNENFIWQFIHDVASGLNYLHNINNPIIHQDIKPENILVKNNHYLISDFNISKKIQSGFRKQTQVNNEVGSMAYMAPERFDSNTIPIKASDIWSLGVTIYELATGELPFSGMGGGMQRSGAALPVLDRKWSKDLNKLMQSCLLKETWKRPLAGDIERMASDILSGRKKIKKDKRGWVGYINDHLKIAIYLSLICVLIGGITFCISNKDKIPKKEETRNVENQIKKNISFNLLDSPEITLNDINQIIPKLNNMSKYEKEEYEIRISALNHVYINELQADRHDYQNLKNIFTIRAGEFSSSQQEIIDWFMNLSPDSQSLWDNCPKVDNLNEFKKILTNKINNL